MLYQAHKNCSKQPTFRKLLIIQRKIKILSEGVIITNFVSKSSEFIELLICEKIAGVIFCLNEMRRKIANALLHPKCLSLPDSRVARLSISIQY